MALPWYEEEWSRGILLGLDADPNTGYRATVWFEYTRALFNEIREGSLIAIQNFSDRPQDQATIPAPGRDRAYQEYSILQIDQVHPWHYAIQGPGERGYPAFTVASAENARLDWTQWDEQNRDDVSRIRCEAIPLRLAFRPNTQADELPRVFTDRSKPMPGFEARLLSPQMTRSIINQGLDENNCIEIGRHVVQRDVAVLVSLPELIPLHFGVFGFTGAGKSNLVSTLTRLALSRQPNRDGRRIFKFVVFDLMDEYTGLLIDQLVQHRWSRVIIAGRNAVDANLLQACVAVAREPDSDETGQRVQQAARTWATRITLPGELRGFRNEYVAPLARLIRDGKVVFYEPLSQQGVDFNLDLGVLLGSIGAQAFGTRDQTQAMRDEIRRALEPLLGQARQVQGERRDGYLDQMVAEVQARMAQVRTDAGRNALQGLIGTIRGFRGSRGALDQGIAISAGRLVSILNFQPQNPGHQYEPSLFVVIGEGESTIATLARRLVDDAFEERRSRSLLYPFISFVFDEADVFIAQQPGEGNVVEQATLLARRGRKFGLGLGIATQRIRYLNTSIMAQPHTYFISKLPRKTDREAIAEAFAISEESLEQSFGFSAGQWLIASHDATGLRGTPFPVQLPNANTAVREWLQRNRTA